jgi:hypothetical protein
VPHVVSEHQLTSLARTVMAQGSRVQSKFVVLHANKCCFIKIGGSAIAFCHYQITFKANCTSRGCVANVSMNPFVAIAPVASKIPAPASGSGGKKFE